MTSLVGVIATLILPFEVPQADLLASEITGRPDLLVSGIKSEDEP